MKIARLFKALVGILTLGLVSCGSFIGPAFPERDGRAFLEKKKYAPEIIAAVVDKKALSRADFERLLREDDTNVLFLVGTNPHLPADLLESLTKHDSDFVRGGASANPNLTSAQILALSQDRSVTTQAHLAANPKVPEALLVKMYESGNVGLVHFAMNPKCPAVLQKKMREENDELSLHWLKETQEEAKRR